jgi:hypothetical protein
MVFRETVALYCENFTEHTDTVRTSQETHHVSATESNRLMLFRETVAFYCEKCTEHIDTFRTSQETHYLFATEKKSLLTVRTERNTNIQYTLWAKFQYLLLTTRVRIFSTFYGKGASNFENKLLGLEGDHLLRVTIHLGSGIV